MTAMPSPEPNWGRDNSDSLILGEQAKSLPESLRGSVDTKASDTENQVKDATGLSTAALLSRLTDCERDGKTYLETYTNPARQRSHKAYRNEHFEKSKYLSSRYATRSKLFKPKTRNAVRKAQAAAAAALFGAPDVVDVTASDESNPQQVGGALVNKELLNYRLDRANGRSSIPWFLVSMGAHQDGLLDGVCASKQFWKWREIQEPAVDENGDPVMKQIPQDDGLGNPIINPLTGEPVMVETDEQEIRSIILADRPDCINVAPENIIFDPNCEWTRPAQTSPYLIVRFPMPLRDVMQMMEPSEFAGAPTWIEHSEAELESLAVGTAPTDAQANRNARSGGADGHATRLSGLNRLLWVYENFLSIKGEDYTFWSIGNQRLLSIPMPTRKAYPPFGGERPYVVGYGAIETHRPLPMSPAESWQQLQQEANDVTNLRLDQMKQVVTPITKVKRGRQIDLEQVFRRGQDTAIMLTDMEDIEFDRPPDVPPSALAETNILNNDFDELAGTFSQGSVQSNRSLNETVGGMKLLAGGANSITEFDLRVWVETWVEPVLWQLVRLEQWYESDDKILALAGQKAEIAEKFGISEINDDLLMQDVTVRVSAGIGASDPMQKLEKFAGATKITMEMMAPFIQAGAVKLMPKADAIIDETYGLAGYKGAAERFFDIIPVDPNAPGPEQMAMQAEAEQAQRAMAMQKEQADAEMGMKQQQLEREHQLKVDEAKRKEQQGVAEHLAKQVQQKRQDEQAHAERLAQIANDNAKGQREHEFKSAQLANDHDKHAREIDHKRELHYATLDADVRKGDADRDHEAAQAEADRMQADAHENARLESAEGNHAAALESKERTEAARAEAKGDDGASPKKKTGKRPSPPTRAPAGSAAKSFDDMKDSLAQVSAAMAAVLQAVNAPKEITLKRGAQGIEGATVRPAA